MSLLSFFHHLSFFHSRSDTKVLGILPDTLHEISSNLEDDFSIHYPASHDYFNEYYYGSYHGLGICPNHYKED